jgi:cytochrome c-type biogenesis protein CcmF
MTLAAAILVYSFLTHDFGVRYVYENSSRAMPSYLVAASFWGGQAGSLLYWAWTLALFAALVAYQHRDRNRPLMPWVLATLMGIEVFFLIVLTFVSNPFARFPAPMPDGRGLNPLLRAPGMLIHPPMLLAGYMSFSVPFAFALAALLSGRVDNQWLRASRPYALAAWAIQSAGLLLGGWWAYHVLGWGGYWGWDPVENVALLPWLAMTAFVHSVMVQQRRDMLKTWNFILVILSFNLAIFGTFVVRSGVITSVHSFAQSAIGPYFLTFLGVTTVVSVLALFRRWGQIRSAQRFDSLLSREAGFLLNNLLFIAVLAATFWGTIFPLLSEAVQGTKITVGAPFYNQVNGPLFLAIMLLMGFGPLLGWRRTSPSLLWRNLRWPLLITVVGTAALFVLGVQRPVAIVAAVAIMLTGVVHVQEFWRGAAARRSTTRESWPAALLGLVARHRQRYGGYLVHIGVVLLAAGIAGSTMYQAQREQELAPGESTTLAGYTVRYVGIGDYRLPDALAKTATVHIEQDGRRIAEIYPTKRFYRNFEQQPTTEVAVYSTFTEDVYVYLAGWTTTGAATLHIFVNPMILWVWLGGLVALLGAVVAMWPQREMFPVYATRLVREGAPSDA